MDVNQAPPAPFRKTAGGRFHVRAALTRIEAPEPLLEPFSIATTTELGRELVTSGSTEEEALRCLACLIEEELGISEAQLDVELTHEPVVVL